MEYTDAELALTSENMWDGRGTAWQWQQEMGARLARAIERELGLYSDFEGHCRTLKEMSE